MRVIRTLPLQTYNLNFYIEDKEIIFDQKVTPLLSACFTGKIDTVILLLMNEYIDVDMESQNEGYTPIMVACFKGYYEITRLLIEKNADVMKVTKSGQAPIIFCFSRLEENFYKYENKRICMMLLDLLLSKGANINTIIDNSNGWTIMMKLVSVEIYEKEKFQNTVEIVKFLIERGADKDILSSNRSSIYDLIKESEYKEGLIKALKHTEYESSSDTPNMNTMHMEREYRYGNCCFLI
jgi:ankyrin repeat protein